VIQSFTNAGAHKIALFPLGNMMSMGRRVAAQLTAEGYDVALINPRFIKPLDAGLTEFYGRAADVVVTLEDHVLMGGYGSAVLELFNEKRITTPVIQVGWPDQFIEHASTPEELRQKYGLTVENTVARVQAQCAQAAVTGQRAVAQLR
jgi:1-deoxy-D-xylulose-5-phosphate synthase